MTWRADLGFASYEEYLRSPHWRTTRRKAGRAAFWSCACGSRATDIHHRSYEHLGDERPEDLRAVCRPCHDKIHERVKVDGMALADATDTVLGSASPRPGVVVLAPGRRTRPGKSKKPKARKKSKKKAKTPQARAKSKKLARVAAENDRLHEIQVRNRIKREIAQERRALP